MNFATMLLNGLIPFKRLFLDKSITNSTGNGRILDKDIDHQPSNVDLKDLQSQHAL